MKEQRVLRTLGTCYEKALEEVTADGWYIKELHTSACNGIDTCWMLLERDK